MNYFKISICVLLACLIVACNDNEDVAIDGDNSKYLDRLELTPGELVSIIYEDGDKTLTNEETLDLLNEFVNIHATKSQNSYEFVLVDKITTNSENAIKTKSSKTTLNVVFHQYAVKPNTKSGADDGFAIVCADKRFPSVLAFAENGELEKATETGAFMMIENAKQLAIKEIATIKYLEDSLRTQTINKLNDFRGVEEFDLEKSLDRIYVDGMDNNPFDTATKGWATTPSGTTIAIVGPLTSNMVTWNQTYPYNMYAPSTIGTTEEGLFISSSYSDYYPSGCAVVAMAQIAAYFRPTITTAKYGTINWSQVLASPSTYDPQSAQAKQIASIMSAIAIGSGTTYSANGGSTNTSNARSFMSGWGIYMNNGTTCNFQNMKASLDALRLIYTTGTCRQVGTWATKSYTNGNHAWITDGYQIRQRGTATRQILKQYNVWSSCNFGWGGSYDGWYLFESDGSISYSVAGWEGIGPYDLYDINLLAFPCP